MGFFSKLFGRNKEQPVQETSQNEYDWNQIINIQRDDGSNLSIKPKLDKDGNQILKTITDEHGFVKGQIPEYLVFTENEMEGFRGDTIYMNVAKECLLDPNYSHYIANSLLSENRLNNKVLTQYLGYTGELTVDQYTGELGKAIDPNVVKSLQHEALVKERREYRDEFNRREDIFEHAQGLEVNVKTSHAEELSKVPNPYNNRGNIADMNRNGISDDRGR